MLLQGSEERTVRIWIVERPAGRADHTVAAQRQNHCDRSNGEVQLLGNDSTQFSVFLRCGPHQCYLWIMLVEFAALELYRDRFRRTKVDHIETAGRNDGWNAFAGSRFEASRTGGQYAADQFIRPFGCR